MSVLGMGTVQSVDRALLLLSEIGREPGGLVALSTRVRLATSTTGRLLATLEHAGAVVRGDDGSYHIGPLVHGMVSATDSTASLEAIAHPLPRYIASMLSGYTPREPEPVGHALL